ncbi:MAG: hybrid sensor histidine kinase/response regulator [Bacteroidota bacterium]
MNVTKENTTTISNILIVDDVPANLKVLGDILKGEGYKVRPVPNGNLALQVAEKEKPDLILLDIMMPDMNGYEVCSRLKEDPNLNDIPVIFISALNDTKDIVKALNSGGVDYITKPFQAEEVKARVATHLKICKQSKELQKLNAQKDKFFSIIAHDLRNPLGGFMALTEMMAADLELIPVDEQKELMLNLNQSASNIFNLLENLLEWSQMQRGQIAYNPEMLNLHEVVDECSKSVNETARNKAIEIICDIDNDLKVYADSNMIQTVIRNLVSNAVKFTEKGGKINVYTQTTDEDIEISIKDTGIGMNSMIVENLFKLDGKTNRAGTEGELSTGLGLILCKDFVEKHGGKIWAESQEGVGSVFTFTVPIIN